MRAAPRRAYRAPFRREREGRSTLASTLSFRTPFPRREGGRGMVEPHSEAGGRGRGTSAGLEAGSNTPSAIGGTPRGGARYAIVVIVSSTTPAGALMVTVSPRFLPRSARPTGDLWLMRPCVGSASVGPTS